MRVYLGETIDDIAQEMRNCSTDDCDNADATRLACRIEDWYQRLVSAIYHERIFFNHGEMPHYKEVR